jgi:AraC family transcriptional regulator
VTENADYIQRVNRAIDYILSHLGEPLRLDDVAAIACFSPFHFHRIFSSLVGETLTAFVTRLRLQRSLTLLLHNPELNLTQVALRCGFGSSSNFPRVFKKRFDVAPSQFDLDALRESRRGEFVQLTADAKLERLPPGENPDGFAVSFLDLPARTVAYLRVTQPYQDGRVVDAAQRLVQWAEARGLHDGRWLGYMWDNPEVVALDDCRYDVGVEVPEGIRPDGEVGVFVFPAMRVATVPVRGSIELEQRALDWMYGTWLPRARYVPDDQPAFEAWIGRPFAHGTESFEIDLHLPVRRY